MKFIINFILGVLICLLLSPHTVSGCSLVVPAIRQFNTSEYIFIGEVIKFIGPLKSRRLRTRAWGLLVKVEDKVYLPKSSTGYFEVMPYELWADCSMGGRSEEELAKSYPIGSKVKVIATEAKLLPAKTKEGNIRLERLPGSHSRISRNYYEDGRIMTSAQSVFDYASYKRVTPADYVESFMPYLDAHSALPEFELRKDLLRLKDSKAEDERLNVLERLLHYPHLYRFDYRQAAQTYVQDPHVLNTLIARWELRNLK